jgi:hypothetical protein
VPEASAKTEQHRCLGTGSARKRYRRRPAIEFAGLLSAGTVSGGARVTSVLYTTKELSALLKIPEQTLRQWRCAGLGPDYIKLGTGPRAAVRYTLKDVEDYIDQHRHTSAVRAFVTEEFDVRP